MGKVFLNEFRKKLTKKIRNNQLSKTNHPINIQELQDKKNRRFYTSLSDYLTNEEIRKSIKKVNENMVKYSAQPTINSHGMGCIFSVSLSLNEITDDGKELWECIVYESDDYEESEKKSEKFDNNRVAIEYFMNQILSIYN